MKLIVKILIVCFFLFSFYGCSESEKATKNPNGMNIIDKSLLAPKNARGMEERYNLFTFSNDAELKEKLPQAIIAITDAAKYDFGFRFETSRIVTEIEVKDGKAVVPEWRYYNLNGKLTERFVYNFSTFYYDSVPVTGMEDEPNGGCPPGTEYLGICQYNSDFGSCVGNATVTYVVGALTNHKTPTVTVTNTPSFARICGSAK